MLTLCLQIYFFGGRHMQNRGFVYNVREVNSIRELCHQSAELFADKTAFLFKKDGIGVEITYARMMEDVRALATYLNSIGLSGKHIAVTGKNSYFWAITYLAVACGVGVVVPIDKDLSCREVDYILEHSETSAVMISPEISDKFEECGRDVTKLYMDKYSEYVEEGHRLLEEGDTSYADHKIDPYGLGVLLYTSGTTGVAKGVMLSQYNITSDIICILRSVKVTSEDRTISVLPLHHTYECNLGFIAMLYCGASIAYNESLKTLQRDLAEYKPTIFVSVPLILERFHKLVNDKYRKIKGGESILSLQKKAAKISNMAIRKRIFSAVSDAFGGRLRLILCGAAPLDPKIFRDYELFGITVYIGYGLTETAPVCLMHSDFYRSPDDNGYPMAGTSAKIFDANAEGIGELGFKGPNVMLGYYKNPEETAKVMRDGWFMTGDLAYKNPENGTFKIVGRVKSMIVTPSGKKVFPEELEAALCESKLIEECLVHSVEEDGKVIICASFYPNEDEVELALLKDGITPENEDYEKSKKELIMSVITELNDDMPSYKAIRRLIVRQEEFEKTTTKKIKRNAPENLV